MLRNFTRLFCSTTLNRPIKEFQLSLETRSKLRALGVTELFPIQQACLKPIMEGKDVVAKAKTGTGKTFAFALPVIERLQSEEELDKLQKVGRSPRVLTLAPTRELANQTASVFSKLVSYGGLTILPVYGGVGYDNQTEALRQGVDIVVGAPGRVKDLVHRGALSLIDVDYVILDEVDRMLDMGFLEDVDNIIKGIYSEPKDRPQTMLFSATIPNWMADVSHRYLDKNNTEFISIEDDTMTPATVRHISIPLALGAETAMLSACLEKYLKSPESRAIVFCDRKRDADALCAKPMIQHKRASLHGDLSQSIRDKVLNSFRRGTIQVLFTTDVAARGLDIPDVDLVIQMSPPSNCESYVHRSGRTGRAGNHGVSICFFKSMDRQAIAKIEQVVGIKFESETCPTSEIFINIAKRKMEKLMKTSASLSDEFMDLAKEMIEEVGAEKALSLALVQLSGRTESGNDAHFVSSLLTGRQGWKTMILKLDISFVPHKTLLYNLLEKAGLDLEDKISHVQFVEGRKAIVFDLDAHAESELLRRFKNNERFTMEPLEENCPPLEHVDNAFGRSRGGFRQQPRFRSFDVFDRSSAKRFREY